MSSIIFDFLWYRLLHFSEFRGSYSLQRSPLFFLCTHILVTTVYLRRGTLDSAFTGNLGVGGEEAAHGVQSGNNHHHNSFATGVPLTIENFLVPPFQASFLSDGCLSLM